MHKVTKEELESMNREGLRCAAELADARVDVMSTACLVAIMAQGPGYHRRVEEEFRLVVAESGARCKVMTSADVKTSFDYVRNPPSGLVSPRKGALAAGSDADITALDPSGKFILTKEKWIDMKKILVFKIYWFMMIKN